MPHAIAISPDLELAARMDQEETAREVALHLISLGKLSMGKAAEVAEIAYCDFLLLAASRG
jgi:predicted HTH domain antitoxin